MYKRTYIKKYCYPKHRFKFIYSPAILFFILSFFSYNHLFAQTISGVINTYHKVLAIDAVQNKLKLDNITGINPLDKVLIIQMKGAAINAANSSSFGDISSISTAGNYEFATICGIYSDTVILRTNMVNTYTISGLVQLVTMPVYGSVTVSDTLKAQAWDASTGKGGVLALQVNGILTLNSGISASGKGFSGGTYYNFGGTCSSFFPASNYYYDFVADGLGSGAYKGEGIADFVSAKQCGKGKQANGGGGGNNHNSGGAGGANYGSGGNGGNQTGLSCNGTNPGIGGAALSSYGYSAGTNKIFLGGGGGAGHTNNDQGVGGGDGGGIVFIKCDLLDGGNHTIEANGLQPYNATNSPNIYEANGDGGGGGGAGGAVIIEATTISTNVTIQAKGGDGNNSGFLSQCTGPGGGGGGGAVWLSSSSLPGTVTTNVNGGANGVVKVAACLNNPNGATAGGNGSTLLNYVRNEGTAVTCTLLPANPIINFTGNKNGQSIYLSWHYTNAAVIERVVLERSIDQNHFSGIKEYTSINQGGDVFTDAETYNSTEYRLLVYTKTRDKFYSQTLRFKKEGISSLLISPVPVKDKLLVEFTANKKQALTLTIFSVDGKKLWQQQYSVIQGKQTLTVFVPAIAKGIYFLQVNANDELQTKKLIKQ
ncbi:MAG: T9SS type A sorting domain-containing protein [Sphingobacteriales bacterium]|nr:T9SS type A sorting domain-containing protein [Sphingobacteriales bacterium]